MPIPKYNEMFKEVLVYIKDNPDCRLKDFESPLANTLQLTEDEVNEEYASGNGKIFIDRVSWTLSYLNMAGMISKPKRGVYQISEIGDAALNSSSDIKALVEEAIAKRDQRIKKEKEDTDSTEESSINSSTPIDDLESSVKKLKSSTYERLIEEVLSKDPRTFENLVVQLLQKMGYGGEIKDAGSVTSYSNDGGIDGIIKEDVLGLGRIHIQAKRYAIDNTVGREEIQKFVGALAVAQSNKGVFITTSKYSKGAVEYAENLNGSTNLVLIDGEKLAEYMYEYGLGVQTRQVLEIKEIDSDFWEKL